MGRILGRMIKALLLSAIVLCLGFAALLFWALEDQPQVAAYDPPSPQDVVAARRFVHEVKAALDPGNPTDFIRADEAQLNGVIKLGARLIPGFRGAVQVEDTGLNGQISVPVPQLPVPLLAGKWINLSARIPSFEDRLELADVSLGPVPLPPGLTLDALRIGINQLLGDGQGDWMLAAAGSLSTKQQDLTLAINQELFGPAGSNGLMRRLFGALRGGNPPEPAHIARHYVALRQAMDAGQLPREGSYLPYIRFSLEAAQQEAKDGGDIAEAYTAAIFALTLACGAQDFTLVVGGLSEALDGVNDQWNTSCNKLTLNGRIDSRRHFTTAAAIQAASNRGVAVSIGEFKELYDSSKSGGFDFTDIAANNSGIRMSNTLMGAPLSEWPALVARLAGEADVIIAYDGIPQIMSGAEFETTFGDLEDARYQNMLARIETKIDALALHRE